MAEQDITWVRGQTEEWTVAIILAADGSPEDLSDALAVEFEVKKFDGQPDPYALKLAIGTGITLRTQTGGNVGLCDLVATDTQTFALAAGAWRYDVFVTRADGGRKRAINGDLVVADVDNFPA